MNVVADGLFAQGKNARFRVLSLYRRQLIVEVLCQVGVHAGYPAKVETPYKAYFDSDICQVRAERLSDPPIRIG